MKKKLLFKTIAFFLLGGPLLYAQWQDGLWIGKQAHNWHFGVAAGLDFNFEPPQALTGSAMEPGFFIPDQPEIGSGIEGTGSVSDADGTILFYTNGVSVWNANNELMPNGTGLQGNASSTQSGLIVPMPGNADLFYIFSIDSYNSDLPLVYSIVDMTLDGGQGDVTSSKNIQIATGVQEKISAVHHSDGEKVWVMVHSDTSSDFSAFLISDEGINPTPVVSTIGLAQPYSSIGQMKFSPNGELLAKSGLNVGIYVVEVFNFDNDTGEVENVIATFNSSDFPGELLGCYGIEFSPDSTLLYAASVFTAKVYQFNLLAGTEQEIKDSGTVIGQDIEFSNFSMQLAPDGKIYIARGNFGAPYTPYLGTQSELNVINYPNNLGMAAGFSQQGVDLLEGRNDLSLPGFIQSYFASGILYEGSCEGEEISFSTLRIPGITAISWNFGDPASGEANISSEGSHVFNSAGTYTVTAIITSNNTQQIVTLDLTIYPVPSAATPTVGLAKCADASGQATFDLSEFDTMILAGQDPMEISVTYFANGEDLELNSPISEPQAFTTEGQMIFVRVLNTVTGCFKTLAFNLVVNPTPTAFDPGDMRECEISDGAASFNLVTLTSIIQGNQDSFTVAFYRSEMEAQEGENPIIDVESFQSSGQSVYAVVTDPLTGCISRSVEVNLIVVNAPDQIDRYEFTGCAPYNLEALTVESDNEFNVTFYTTEQDAIIQSNAISNPSQYVFSGNADLVYVLVENHLGCTTIGQLQLYKDNCEIQRGISPNGDSMNEVFDLSGLMVSELQIFNRYGIKVYERRNYTNEWGGQSDTGESLPTGTYYYVILLASGESSKTGWIYINREN